MSDERLALQREGLCLVSLHVRQDKLVGSPGIVMRGVFRVDRNLVLVREAAEVARRAFAADGLAAVRLAVEGFFEEHLGYTPEVLVLAIPLGK